MDILRGWMNTAGFRFRDWLAFFERSIFMRIFQRRLFFGAARAGTLAILAAGLLGAPQPAQASDKTEGAAPATGDVVHEFEALSRESPYFEISDVLYRGSGVSGRDVSNLDFAKYSAFISRFLSIHPSKDQLIPLLKHADPKVRTLAIAALGSMDDPTMLPAIADLLADDTITFWRVPMAQQSAESQSARTDATVGENAQAVLFLYMGQAGYTGYQFFGSRTKEQRSREEFDKYWNLHKDRKYCASWFAEQMSRTGSADVNSWEIPHVRAGLVKRVPEPDRTWIALWLRRPTYWKAPYSDSELVAMCRKLGPDALMNVLKQHRFPSDDPDLQHIDPNLENSYGAQFILEHATSLLRPQDADVLVALNKEDDAAGLIPSPLWFVAAAQLQPANAVKILRDAYAQFPSEDGYSRVTLSVALWRTGGESQTPFLSDQFYSVALLRDGWAEDFIDGIAAIQKPSASLLIASILRDKRLDDLKMDPRAFSSLVAAVNGWLKAPVVSDAELKEATKYVVRKNTKGGGPPDPADYPIQQKLLRRLRDTVPQWGS